MSLKVQHSTQQINSGRIEKVLGDIKQIFGQLQRPAGIEGIISTDTLKMRLPLPLVHIKDDILFSKEITVNSLTGNVTNEKVSTVEKDKTFYRIEPVNENGRTPENFLVIALGSKLLKERYLEGITIENKNLIYDAIKSHGLVDFSIDSFMDKSRCVDIDFKKDVFYQGDVNKLINKLYSNSKPKKKIGFGAEKFLKADNKGIQWSIRETTNIVSNPFLKMYAKDLELIHKHPDFHSKYLGQYDLSGLLRLEATLKNKRHFFRLFNHKCTNLWAVLNMPQDDKQRVFDHAIHCHINPKPRKRLKQRTLKGNKVALYKSMCLVLNSKVSSFEDYLDYILKEFDNKTQRYRMRKTLDELYQVYLGENDADLFYLEDIFWGNSKTA